MSKDTFGNDLPEFRGWPSIPRLKRGCIITEKIDGTNGIVHVGEDGRVLAGSRNRWLVDGADNYGFAGWVAQNADQLRTLGPGYHYGEWWGPGIQRGYGIFDRRWYLFNSSRWGGSQSERPACCGVVPVLYAGEYTPTCVEETLQKLREAGSIVAPGFMNPEGIVVYLPAAKQMFKVTLDGDGHKNVRAA